MRPKDQKKTRFLRLAPVMFRAVYLPQREIAQAGYIVISLSPANRGVVLPAAWQASTRARALVICIVSSVLGWHG